MIEMIYILGWYHLERTKAPLFYKAMFHLYGLGSITIKFLKNLIIIFDI